MSREIVGATEPGSESGTEFDTEYDTGPAGPDTPAGPRPVPGVPRPARAAREPPAARARRPSAVGLAALALPALAGAVLGWSACGAWLDAERRTADLASAGASAVVVGLDTSVGGLDDAQLRVGDRSAALRVSLLNLGAVPLRVAGREDSFSAVRIRSVEPPGLTVAPRTRTAVDVVVEVRCGAWQALRVPPLRVTAPDGFVRDVPLDGTAQVLADLCAVGINGSQQLVVARVADPADGVWDRTPEGLLPVFVRAPSGRTTRIVGVRSSGLVLGADPLPTLVAGSERLLRLRQPAACDASVTRSGLPRSADLEVDAGSGQTATVPVLLGDAFAGWLLTGPCGETGP